MPKESRDKLKAAGRSEIFHFDPERLVLVEKEDNVLYDDRVKSPVNEELVLNIMYAPDGKTPQGVLKPLLGRRNPETEDVEIIDGRNRTKAAREANKRLKKQGLPTIRVPVMLKRADDSRLMAMLISSNEHNTDDTPMNRARKAQRYIDLGHDEKEVAQLLGTSEATIKNLLRLLEAPAAVRNALDSGKIAASDAYRLAREEPAEARRKVAELIEKAPRTPGKKRSPNAKKAREVMGRSEPAADAAPVLKGAKKLEDAVANAIASWIEATWNEGNWNGAPSDIPILIRKGDWREHRDGKAAE